MATISYTPKNWHGSDSAPNAPETVRLKAAVQTALDAEEARIDAEAYTLGVLALTAGSSVNTWLVPKGTARTVSAIHLRVQNALASALGDISVAVQTGDLESLLSTSTVDGEALTTSFVAQTLTATTSRLSMAAGEPIRLVLNSTNGDATGGPVIVRVTYSD